MGNVDRAERLLVLVAGLRRAAAGRTALAVRDLAGLLAVSERTVRRDVAELQSRGLLVRSGPAGLSLATADAAQPARAARSPGTRRPARARRRVATELADPLEGLVSPVSDTVTEAVRAHRVVRIVYTAEDGEATVREVEAQGLVVAPYGEYLVGWCRLRDAARTFRLDRIAAACLVAGEASRRDLDDLLAALRVPLPRGPLPAGGDPARPVLPHPGAAVAVRPEQGRGWVLERIAAVRRRAAVTASSVTAEADGAAALRLVLGHLAGWTRRQLTALQNPAAGAADDAEPSFAERERRIQDTMALRSLGELARDLDQALLAAAHWVADCDEHLWRRPRPDPADPSRHRSPAELLAGWPSPLAHIEWHLEDLETRELEDVCDPADDGTPLITRCPLPATTP
jgi:hypothetical protein